MTADTAHLVATGEETRQTLYVGVSRGADANHIYLGTGSTVTRTASSNPRSAPPADRHGDP